MSLPFVEEAFTIVADVVTPPLTVAALSPDTVGKG